MFRNQLNESNSFVCHSQDTTTNNHKRLGKIFHSYIELKYMHITNEHTYLNLSHSILKRIVQTNVKLQLRITLQLILKVFVKIYR